MNERQITATLLDMYRRAFGLEADAAVSVVALPRAGSDRLYYRIKGDTDSCIATFSPDAQEGRCFVALARDFHSAGCRVPRIIAASGDCRFYLQQDLGDVSLFSLLKEDPDGAHVKSALTALVKLQRTCRDVWQGDCMNPAFSRRQVMWDLNYFKYEFLKLSGVIFNEHCLEDDFESLAGRLAAVPDGLMGFMMRDCQSRNVMVTPDGPVFIDFQGGRFGPVLYDAVSLLWQARAGFDARFRREMLSFYADAYCGGDDALRRQMMESLPDMVLFRTLQVLGAYGFRGLIQRRAHFLLSIPGAMANLRDLLRDGALDRYPELKKACVALADDPRFGTVVSDGRLRVEVFSFSYKKGYPDDRSGNGGGFMFDCRAMHNPGRYEEYRSLTGRDMPVVRFLEDRGEAAAFLKSVWALVDPAVERYLARGFSNLQIGFGCTGGQHRSVYCAESTARHLRLIFPEADVVLTHREHP